MLPATIRIVKKTAATMDVMMRPTFPIWSANPCRNAPSASVLVSCCELAKFLGCWRGVLILAFPLQGVVECPVFNVTLASLHNRTTDTVPAIDVFSRIRLREMNVGLGHLQRIVYAIKTKLHICPGE